MESTTLKIMTTVAEVTNKINISVVDDKTAGAKAQFLLYDILIPTFGSFIILTNLLVVISSGLILKKGQQPRSTYLFLGNVAMTDLITGIAVVFGQTFPRQYRDQYVCAFQIGLIVSSTLASVYSVGLIAIDRFLYILHGIQYQTWVYPTRARLMILFTWIIGCLVGFLPLFGWRNDTQNGKYCWFITIAPKEAIALTVAAGIVPLLVILVLYSIILYHALRKVTQLQNIDKSGGASNNNKTLRMFRGKQPQPQENPAQESIATKGFFAKFFTKKPSSSVRSPNKWKAVKVVLYTTGSFVITWCPYFITSLIYVNSCDATNKDTKWCKNISLLIASPLVILGLTNSLINPVIYAWWHKGFRSFVKRRVNTFMLLNRRENNADVSSNAPSQKTSSSTNLASGKISFQQES